jgi:tetratricopeptide (TPR) repeat protein
MAIESSDPCPCGSNKKIKFCCGQAIAPELEKIARSLEGEQFMAAIERLKTLIDQHGELPCLLALKGLALISSGQVQEAHANAGQFCELDPDNATAWAQRALTVGEDADADLALGYLQKSLELADPSQLAPITLPALQVVTDVLFQSGNAFGGFWHLSLQLAFQRNDQQSSLMQVLPFTQNRSIPLLLKQQLQIPDAPAEFAWQEQYDEALVLAGRGAWMASREVILAIDADDPTLTHAIACLSTFLGDTQQGPAAWRRFGTTCEPESDEAVEAEAYAQLLQNQVATDTVDLVTLTYAVTDVERLQEQLVSSRQVRFVPDFQWPAADADNPPPRAAFILLDREMPDSGEQISIEQVPQAVATACLFGKQTDQEARIECALVSAADPERDQPLVEQVLGELAAELQSRETSGQVGTAADALSWHPVWPEKTSSDTIQQFNVDQRNTALEEKWPELPLATFDGASARQIVENEGGRIKVMAAILLMETNMQAMDHLIDLDSLRQNLGLTAPGPIDPETIDIKGYPDIRFSRFLPNKMSMDQLTTVYSRGVFLGNSRAIILAAREITSREEKPENLNMAEVYGSLVETASSNSERIELLQKCRQAAHDQEQSPAIWLLREIPLQLAEGNGARVSEIIQVIQAQHMQEPGIAEQLYSLLVQMGILNPDGTPATPTTAPAAGSDGIWTPDGSTSSSEQAEGGEKSSIWVPGMD